MQHSALDDVVVPARLEPATERFLWVPKEARWTHLLAHAKQPDIGRRIDDVMIAVEALPRHAA